MIMTVKAYTCYCHSIYETYQLHLNKKLNTSLTVKY